MKIILYRHWRKRHFRGRDYTMIAICESTARERKQGLNLHEKKQALNYNERKWGKARKGSEWSVMLELQD